MPRDIGSDIGSSEHLEKDIEVPAVVEDYQCRARRFVGLLVGWAEVAQKVDIQSCRATWGWGCLGTYGLM